MLILGPNTFCAGAILPLLSLLLQGEGGRLPDFDHKKIEAAYVVSLPESYDAKKRWPLILDFHGAISPSRKGASFTKERLWAKFVKRVPCIVVGIEGRTRAWGMVKGDTNDKAYAARVLEVVKKRYSIDPKRIYLAGFSSGSDFLCKSRIQVDASFRASLVTCPGPANVVGLKDGSLLAAKATPFYLVTGEEDYIRKDGAWQAFLALDRAGARVMYREVPKVGHSFFPVEEYERLFKQLELFSAEKNELATLAHARAAVEREDWLLASTIFGKLDSVAAKEALVRLHERGKALTQVATSIDASQEPGRSFEAWWRLRTQFHRFPDLAERAQKELDTFAKGNRRELYRARREWFRRRKNPLGKQTPRKSAAKRRERVKPARRRIPIKPYVEKAGPWAFDRYVDYDMLTSRLKALARLFPERAKLISIGKSIQGRELWVLELSDRTAGKAAEKPAAFVQGGIHGNETSSVTTLLYMAWHCAANPQKKRSVERLMRDTTLYIMPAVNPDAVQHFLNEPHSYWRPRFNYRPFDADGDGKVDEDGYEDLDKDGEIGLMYAEDPEGPYVLKNGRMLRGKGKKTYKLVGREGIDNDGDGRYSEDPPGGVDLNRNFPQGFKARRSFEGFRGPRPLSEPETKAVVDFVTAKRNISYFFDYHNAAKTFFYWLDPAAEKDRSLFDELATRVEQSLDYVPRALTHDGVGLAIAWAYGRLGLFAGIVELEAHRGDAKSYFEDAWEGKAFIAPKAFEHPTLGPILIGNDYRKLVKRNPHPKDIAWLAERNFSWLRKEIGNLPKLEILEPCITRVKDGLRVTGIIHNKGALPTDSEKATLRGRAWPVRVIAKGAELVGVQEFGTLAPKGKKAFTLHLKNPGEDVELVFSHPRAGLVVLNIRKPRSRTIAIRRKYEIESGFATPDKAVLANNEFFKQGKSQVGEKGPAFKLTHDKKKLRVAVLLAEWRDRRHVWPRKTFEQLFFAKDGYRNETAVGQAVYGSVRDFYREMSFGALEVEGRVFDWVELPGHYAEYRDASFGSPIVSDRMLAAVKARFGMESLEGYDGYVFVWAGNAVRRTSALWPMRIKPKQLPGKVAFKMGELHHGELTPIGVPCHEMGHCFGVSDKYGLGATRFPLGPWCLMGKGTHGAPPAGRHRPFHLCAWCKMVIGWLEPAVIDASRQQSLALRPITYDQRECFRILLKPDGSEYLLLENRRREGAFTDLPSAGLVVLKVGPNDRPAYPQTRVQLLPAHGKAAVRRGIVPEQQRVAWPQKGKTRLVVGRVVLSELRIVDDVLYFKVGPGK